MKLNTQPREYAINQRQNLSVHSIWSTIQGEGPFAGLPATFVRLAGCNLMCPMCDTDYTSGRVVMPVDHVVAAIEQHPNDLIVITGGEPLRQYLAPLIAALAEDKNRRIQIETNGALPHRLVVGDERFWGQLTFVCSPKTPKIHPDNEKIFQHYKYILDADQVDPYDGLPLTSLGCKGRPFHPSACDTIWVQPLDEADPEKNKRHTDAAVASCRRFGYRLCLQVHKILGLP